MRALLALACAASVIAMPASAQVTGLSVSGGCAVVPILSAAIPVVEVTIGGKGPYRFALDTGAEGHGRIRGMELIEGDALDAEGAKGTVARGAEVLGAAIIFPASSRPGQPALGGDQDVVTRPAPPAERFRDQLLVVSEIPLVPAIDVGGVDEADARIERGADHLDALPFGRSLLEGQVHPAIADDGHRRGARAQGAGLHQARGEVRRDRVGG